MRDATPRSLEMSLHRWHRSLRAKVHSPGLVEDSIETIQGRKEAWAPRGHVGVHPSGLRHCEGQQHQLIGFWAMHIHWMALVLLREQYMCISVSCARWYI